MPITHALPARARRLAALGACALAAAAACSAPPPAHEAIQATLGELPSPAGPDAALPQLAVTPDGRVLTSWLEKSADGRRFRFAALEEDGWTAPVTIAEGDRFFANWADVPSIVALADGTLAAHWLEKSGPDTYAYDVRVRLSRDGGATWSPAVSPHTDGTPTEHGFVSMYDDPAGGLGLVWLDGRAMAGHAGGMDAMQAEMSLRATAFDGDAPRPETLVDGRVCECCPTTAVAVAGGTLPDDRVFDGRDPLPALQGKAASPQRALHWIWNQGRKEQWRGMREGDFKLLHSTDSGPWQLFDLSHDIGEQTDLAASQPKKLQELVQHFDQWKAGIAADPLRSPSLRQR